MSTPKNPGPRLPDKPVRPPTVAQEAPAAPRSSESTGVLERLKAAQPRGAGAADHDGPDRPAVATTAASAGRSGGVGYGASRADGHDRADTSRGPGAAGSRNDPSGGTRTLDAPARTTDSGPAGSGVTRTLDAPTGAEGSKEIPSRQGSDDGGAAAAERLRVAAVRARAAAVRARAAAVRAREAAGVTGRAIHHGSRATARQVSSWDRDVVRQVVVTVCALACILGSAAGVGAFGGPSIRDAAGGLFAPDATLLAPSSAAFSIWSVIYVGLVAYTVFQWLPSQRRTDRQRGLGWTVAASMLLNLAWILSAQAGLLTLSLVVIMLLFFALLSAVRTMNDHPNETRLEGALVDTPIGLYLGWVLLAAAANWAAFLTATGADLFGWSGVAWSILGITAVLVTAAIICSTDRGRLAVAVATSWGLLWIAVERVLGEPFAMNLAFFAVLAIFLLLITAGSRRHRVDHEYRHWLRAQQDARREPVHLGGGDYEDSRY
ncbi:TspO/MBR family protein [Arthrobacter sp. SX1312]|uniref:TspO/MBR family protein n=1 Tax=Arthrobacter sp. SX1312 TaxID=2058896 RepID=UPI000CE30A69|nr:TspO/MBR family protein [Arthrobacter sp. SX1312]